ncbi:hypothetical protein [Caballeronia sp. LZ035]|uniref:hypothetical protein n=1 Tax=Caballeronia sp. LZ035 TaxID=3038568 RepID=UPI00285DFF1E|nr:hypothetical protein [Caballeronia sp. LZ035]MDR5756513.1 hypothetical protein [Caballeronia sp. LZ035]
MNKPTNDQTKATYSPDDKAQSAKEQNQGDASCHRSRITASEASSRATHSLVLSASALTIDSPRKKTSLTVQNASPAKLLVFPAVYRISESHTAMVMVAPLLLELDRDECAKVDFFLLGDYADREQLFHIAFDWITISGDRECEEGNTSLPLLARSPEMRKLSQSHSPLSASLNKHGDITIENISGHILCLNAVATLIPSMRSFIVPGRYLLPGARQIVRAAAVDARSTALKVISETLTGIRISEIVVQLQPQR